VKEHACDVVLLDIDLSHMDGIDVVKAIRKNPQRSQTPIIAISALPYTKPGAWITDAMTLFRSPSKLSN
jgi:DNA-binding response OmpR family regulator